jgi:hypothetical protein
MSDDLRTRIATIVHDKDTVKCCDECTISSPGPWDYEVADAVIRELGIKKIIDVNRSVPQSRYVTEWMDE